MVEQIKQIASKKTFKREVGILLLLFWAVITYRLFWVIDSKVLEAYQAMYGSVTWCCIGFAAAAFGIDHFVTSAKK